MRKFDLRIFLHKLNQITFEVFHFPCFIQKIEESALIFEPFNSITNFYTLIFKFFPIYFATIFPGLIIYKHHSIYSNFVVC